MAADDEPPAKKQKQGGPAKPGEQKAGTQKGKGRGLTLQEVSCVLEVVSANAAISLLAQRNIGRVCQLCLRLHIVA